MALSQAFAALVQDHIHGVTSLTMPAGHRLRLMTANGSSTANGTEVATGGGYTSGTGAPTIAFSAATAATPSVSANSGVVSVTNYPRAETVVGVEVWDNVPRREEWGALTSSKTMASGDTLSFAAAAVASSLS
jgi:hypothetical protein